MNLFKTKTQKLLKEVKNDVLTYQGKVSYTKHYRNKSDKTLKIINILDTKVGKLKILENKLQNNLKFQTKIVNEQRLPGLLEKYTKLKEEIIMITQKLNLRLKSEMFDHSSLDTGYNGLY